MPVTKYDLAILANSYFVATATQPRHPITPDVCAQFAYNCYSIIVGIPSGTNSYAELLRYIKTNADYYGVKIPQAVEFSKKVPGFLEVFKQFLKDNYGIETNSEIIARKIFEAGRYIGNLVAGSIWAILKPLLPIIGIGIGVIYLTNKATTKKQTQ